MPYYQGGHYKCGPTVDELSHTTNAHTKILGT